jgi:hypothetical protein
LTPPRLASQIAAESAFEPDATSDRGGSGIAGLTDAEWELWRPTGDADRSDGVAHIVALAHLMCDLVGRARSLELANDAWPLALAAFRTSIMAVTAIRGVPADAQDYVDQVTNGAALYATLLGDTTSTISPSARPTPTVSASAPPSGAATPSADASTTNLAEASTTASTGSSGTLPAGSLVNEDYGCLTAAARDGTPLWVARCDQSLVQRWETTGDGRLRSVGLCMDAANAGTTNGTLVQVARCSDNPAQLFALDASGHIVSTYAGKCVRVVLDAYDCPIVVLYTCQDRASEFFSLVPEAA